MRTTHSHLFFNLPIDSRSEKEKMKKTEKSKNRNKSARII